MTYSECIIIAEKWPSWISVCLTYPFTSVQVWLQASPASSSLLTFLSRVNTTWSWNTFFSIATLLPHLSPSTILLGQGSTVLLQEFYRVCIPSDFIYCLEGLTPWPCPSSWFSTSWCATSCGSALHGPWSFYSNRGLPPAITSTSSLRTYRLRHCLDCTIRGERELPPATLEEEQLYMCPRWDPTYKCLDGNGFLPRDYPLSRIRCPSVFVQSKWVDRRLSPKKLATVYNVPCELLPTYAKMKATDSSSLPFISSAPGTFLLKAWESSYSHWKGNKGFKKRVSFDLRNLEESSQPSPRISATYLREKIQECQPMVHECTSETTAKDSFDFSRAVKADDAEIPIFIWDDRVWGLQLHCTMQLELYHERYKDRRPLTLCDNTSHPSGF